MGAGARFAEERDRWPDHWRVADLELEEDELLALLRPNEELRAVVPCMRTSETGDQQVLVGITDRRVVLITRHGGAHSLLRVLDVTECAATATRGERLVAHDDGHLAFDVDDDSITRMWAQIDQVAS
jgi:hypothetical protein